MALMRAARAWLVFPLHNLLICARIPTHSLPSPELPDSARRNAAAEYARLLRPGGRLFFVDSAQRGDGARSGMPVANDMALEGFPKYSHEPYYNEYTQTDLVVRPDTRSEQRKSGCETCAMRLRALRCVFSLRSRVQALFGEAGLTCVADEVAWVTKVLVLEKPIEGLTAAPPAAAAAVPEAAAASAATPLADAASMPGAAAAMGEPLQ